MFPLPELSSLARMVWGRLTRCLRLTIADNFFTRLLCSPCSSCCKLIAISIHCGQGCHQRHCGFKIWGKQEIFVFDRWLQISSGVDITLDASLWVLKCSVTYCIGVYSVRIAASSFLLSMLIIKQVEDCYPIDIAQLLDVAGHCSTCVVNFSI